MLRKSHRLFFFPGMGGNNNNAPPGAGGNFANALQQQMMQQQQGGGGGAPGFNFGNMGMNPQALSQLREQMQKQMTPEMRDQMRNQMLQNLGGKQGGGKISLGMMGVGVNEKGKRVARGAKIDFDMATGKMSKDFHEKQLDPDDPMLPKETVENYDTSDCIEIHLDESGKVIASDGGSGGESRSEETQERDGIKSGGKEEEVLEIVIEDVPSQK